jgi:hypothetical protein
MKIITLISVCDFIANASQVNGVPKNNHNLCVLQAIAQHFFYAASWLWSVILSHLLYSLVAHGKISLPEWKMHLIVWSICIAITVLPLTTSTYGTQDNDDFWCWIQPSSRDTGGTTSSNIWEYVTLDCVVFTCFLLLLFYSVLMFYKVKIQQIPMTKTVQTALRTLILYPVIFFITWVPNAIFIASLEGEEHSDFVYYIIMSISMWQGGITAIVFFLNSRESRLLWYNLLFIRCFGCFRCQLQTSHNEPESVDVSEEDFESDDAYYGRLTDPQPEIEIISKNAHPDVGVINNPIYRLR